MNYCHAFSVVFAVLEGVLCAGLVFGWPSLAFVLKRERFFCNTNSQLITVNETTAYPKNWSLDYNLSHETQCDLNTQKESLVAVYSVGCGCFSIGALIAGIVYDKFGTLVSRISGSTLFTCGCVLFSFTYPESSWLLFPSISMVSLGGVFIYTSNLKLGNLFPSKRATIVSLVEGVMDSSSIMFLFVKIAYEYEVCSMHFSFLVIAATAILQWSRTVFCMPRMFIPHPLPEDDFKLGVFSRERWKTTRSNQQSSETRIGSPPLITSLKKLHFWLNIMHLGILQLRFDFFVSTLEEFLENYFHASSTDVSIFINVFGILTFSILLISPINGLMIDNLQRRFLKTCVNKHTASCKANAVGLGITSLIGVLFALLICVPSLHLQYFSVVTYMTVVSFVYAGNCNFIALLFPEEHFGRLLGITELIAAIFLFLQYPLSVLVFRFCDGDFLPINFVFIILCFLTLLHPILLFKTDFGKTSHSEEPSVSVESKLI